MKLDIDLNKLSITELESFLELAKKFKEIKGPIKKKKTKHSEHDMKKIFYLRYSKNKTFAKIAKCMGLTNKEVRKIYASAKYHYLIKEKINQ